MKKLHLFLIVFVFGAYSLQANPVASSVAKTVAQGFYAQHSKITSPNLTLAYTEMLNGQAVYYVFDINTNDGFVIVSAEDATHPILGYSTTGQYVIPAKGSNVDFWMQTKGKQILSIRSKNYTASAQIADEWTSYKNGVAPHNSAKKFESVQAVLPLCKTTWDQEPNYNAYCPGGSVTGCVATAMAQIMRYWSYPAHGIGASSYEDLQSNGFSENYGLLSANYDTSNYAWSAMPLSISSPNNEIAKLMYDCGVSVDMDYTPTGSGAVVLGGNPSAQYSYPAYFGYNSATLKGVLQSSYSAAAWTNLIENELNNDRVVQYAGFDSYYGGHTWVCDGYDNINDFHMNWGWSGADDGYYNVDSLNPSPYDFINSEQILYGIEPPPVLALFTASPTSGCGPLTVTFTDRSLIPAPSVPITSWAWTFTGGTPATSSAQNPTVTYSTPGTYAVTLKVTNSQGSNTITKTSYITVNGGNNPLPLVQGFEGSFPPSEWAINNPDAHSTTWAQYGVGGFGLSSHSMYYNNCMGGVVGEYDQIYTPAYDFTNITKPVLYFDVAYAPYDVSTNPPESDTLVVYYSTDCGQTFTRVYLKGGMTLCTAGKSVVNGANAPSGCFVPLSNNWRTDTIKIPAIAGQSSVLFSFENRSGNGTNLYVDNINIPGVSGASPVAAFKANDSVICMGAMDSVQFLDKSTNSPTGWKWTFPGGTPSTSVLQNPWVKYSGSGHYTGTLIASNNNGSDTLTKTNYIDVKVCTGVDNISGNNTISLYPNPARDEFTVQLGGTATAQLVELYTITGQVVSSNISPEGQSFVINTKDMANGIYFLKVVTQDGNTLVRRVAIEK